MVSSRKKGAKVDVDPWMSLFEASKVLQESRLLVLTRTVKGEIRAQHVAGRTVVLRADVEKLARKSA